MCVHTREKTVCVDRLKCKRFCYLSSVSRSGAGPAIEARDSRDTLIISHRVCEAFAHFYRRQHTLQYISISIHTYILFYILCEQCTFVSISG